MKVKKLPEFNPEIHRRRKDSKGKKYLNQNNIKFNLTFEQIISLLDAPLKAVYPTNDQIVLIAKRNKTTLSNQDLVDYFNILVDIYVSRNVPRIAVLRSLLCVYKPRFYYVYKLYKGTNLVYIGSTKGLSSRMAQHSKTDKDFDRVLITRLSEEQEMLALEQYLIYKEDPPENKVVSLALARAYKSEVPLFEDLLEYEPRLMEAFCLDNKLGKMIGQRGSCNYLMLPNKIFIRSDSVNPYWHSKNPVVDQEI